MALNSADGAWKFINDYIKGENSDIIKKTVVVCSTPLDSAEKIMKNFETAVSLCEYYRDTGKNVLFLNYDFTEILDAAEKFAWEKKEPASENDCRLFVKSWYQNLINRCRNGENGTITSIIAKADFDASDKNLKIANILRISTSGHISLARKIAEQNIYPSVYVIGSVSGFQSELLTDEQKAAAAFVRKLLILYNEKEKFYKSGEYAAGQNPEDDFIVHANEKINSFIKQPVCENPDFEESLRKLLQLVSEIKRTRNT